MPAGRPDHSSELLICGFVCFSLFCFFGRPFDPCACRFRLRPETAAWVCRICPVVHIFISSLDSSCCRGLMESYQCFSGLIFPFIPFIEYYMMSPVGIRFFSVVYDDEKEAKGRDGRNCPTGTGLSPRHHPAPQSVCPDEPSRSAVTGLRYTLRQVRIAKNDSIQMGL